MAEFTKEQLIEHIRDMMESSKEMIDGNGVPVEFVVRAERDIAVYEIALAALEASPEAYVVGNYSLLHYQNPKLDEYIKNATPLYRLPLLEGLK